MLLHDRSFDLVGFLSCVSSLLFRAHLSASEASKSHQQLHASLMLGDQHVCDKNHIAMWFLILQTSLVSAHKLETWLEQHGSEANMTVDALRQFEVLVTKDKVSHCCNSYVSVCHCSLQCLAITAKLIIYSPRPTMLSCLALL